MELANYRVRNFRAIIPSLPCCSEWINVTAGARGFSFRLLFQWGFTSSIFSLKGPSVKHPPCRTRASNGIRSQGNTAYSGVSAFTHTHTHTERERERNKLTNWGRWQHRRRLCVSEVQPGDPHMAGRSPTLSVRGWRLPSNFTLSSLATGAGGGRWWPECCCPLSYTHTHIIWSWPDCGFTQSDPFCCQNPRSVSFHFSTEMTSTRLENLQNSIQKRYTFTLGMFTYTLFFHSDWNQVDSVDCLHETLSIPIWCLHVPVLSIGMTLWHAVISLCPVCRLLPVNIFSYACYFYVKCCS